MACILNTKKPGGNSKKEFKIIIEIITKYNNNDNDYNNKIKVETRQNTATLTFDMFEICLQFDKSHRLTSFLLMKLSLVQ